MKIFLSYASEYRDLAKAISIGLKHDAHEVFFDRSSLQGGNDYHTAIREQVAASDLFVFLIAPESVREDSYAQNELARAEERWPDPSGHVLPVVIRQTPMSDIPVYLRSVTLFQPTGNIEADVLARVAAINAERRRWIRFALPIVVLTGAVLIYLAWPHPQPAACDLNAELTRTDGSSIAPGMVLDVSYGATADSVLVSASAASAIQVGPLKSPADEWTIGVRDADGNTLGTTKIQGCAAQAGIRINDELELILTPRS